MSGNLRAFPSQKIDPTAALRLAEQLDLQEVVILGFRQDGRFYWSGSNGDMRDVQWLLTHAQALVNEMTKGQR